MALDLVHPTTTAQEATLEEARSLRIDLSRLPRHVAIIMDGNGRWARALGMPRIEGHRSGIKSVREVVRTCRELDIPYLTLYAFSVENWNRPRLEVDALMYLLRSFLLEEIREMRENDIRLCSIGRTEDLPGGVRKALHQAQEETRDCHSLQLNLALSYGGRTEIILAARRIAEEVRTGRISPDQINHELFSGYLSTAGIPDPDLLIRTSGEFRVSNFLLWEIAYSEIWITPVLWPDFRKQQLFNALLDYQRRERRFGCVEEVDGAL
ncbi:MAG: isoprenyl transferase [bacterium]